MIFWLLDNLEFRHEDTLWIGVQRSLCSDFAVEARLRKEYPSLDLRMVLLDFQTRGAAETLFIMLQVIPYSAPFCGGVPFSKWTILCSKS